MSKNYNSELQSNNTDLQAILNTIKELPNAGGSDPVLQDKTITPTTSKQTITADSGYDGLDTVTVNAMPTATQATPTITVNSSTGLITATATQNAGYVAAGTKSATKQLAFQAAQTITPGTSNKTIAANTYLGGVQTIKGDANLVAGNIKNGTSIFGVTGTYVGSGGGSGGDTSQEDGLITGTIKNYTNDRVTSIRDYAFVYNTSIISVNFPACRTIGRSAFYFCSSLTSINFPVCTTISHSAFANCLKLSLVSFPACTSIGSNAFYRCTDLVSINFPACTYISESAFFQCATLKTINLPICSVIGSSAFDSCTQLTSINFPECTVIEYAAFSDCRKLTTVSLPKCKEIGGDAFSKCYSLYSISLPACQEIYGHAFRYCSNLTQIYLGSTRMCTLVTSTAFDHTGITSSTGSIFVPASLLALYKSATNWALLSNRIFSYAF